MGRVNCRVERILRLNRMCATRFRVMSVRLFVPAVLSLSGEKKPGDNWPEYRVITLVRDNFTGQGFAIPNRLVYSGKSALASARWYVI